VKATKALERPCSPFEREKQRTIQELEARWLSEANHWAFGVIDVEPDIFGDVARSIKRGRIPPALLAFMQEEDTCGE